jgi:membrane protein DedA with SNARE-associated domain
MLNTIINHLLIFSGWSALALVFILPALESSVFLGFVIPGETAVVVGGFLAYEHKVPLAAVFVIAIAGAIIGDSVGYEIGRKWGDALLDKAPKRIVKPVHVVQGKQLINRLGGRAVFAGRWTAVLRALVPSLCGTAKMRYRTFLLWNALGGITWATAFILIGYLAGTAWKRVEGYANSAGYIFFGVIIVAGIGFAIWNRRKQAKKDAATEAEMGTSTADAAEADNENEHAPKS